MKNAMVIADGVVIQRDKLLMGARLMMADGFFPSVWNSPIFHDFDGRGIGGHIPDDKLRLGGRTVSLISLGWQVYGHMLLDVLPRIERVLRSGLAFDRFLLGAPQQWHKDLIALTGLEDDQIVFIDNNSTAIICDDLILPVIDRSDSELHPDVMHVFNRIKAPFFINGKKSRNLFISREKWGGTRVLDNRNEVEDIARRAGFEIVLPEMMTFTDQLSMFASARAIFGEAGSGLHATLFSGSHSKVGVIQRWDHTNFLQSQIGAIANQRVGYALGEPTTEDRWTVDPDAVSRLAAYLLS